MLFKFWGKLFPTQNSISSHYVSASGLKTFLDICVCACVCVLVTQLCPTLWDPMDCSPPDSSVHGILQVRILEWVAILFSRGSSQPRDWTGGSFIAGRFLTIWATREAWLFISMIHMEPFLKIPLLGGTKCFLSYIQLIIFFKKCAFLGNVIT